MNMYESIKESYNYIGTDTGEKGRDDKSHIEHIFTVYDQYGEVDTFKTREAAEQYIEEHKDDTFWQEEGMEQPEYRIEEDDIEVLNNKIVVQDDMYESSTVDVSSVTEGLVNYVVNSISSNTDLRNRGVKFEVKPETNRITFITYQDGKPVNTQLINIDEIKRSIK